MRENFLAVTLDPFRNGLEQLDFSAASDHLSVSCTLVRSEVAQQLVMLKKGIVCGGNDFIPLHIRAKRTGLYPVS